VAERLRVVLVVLTLLAIASTAEMAEAASIGWPPSVRFTLNAHVTPGKLPKGWLAGISLRIGSKVWMADRSHPPALQELLLELDKNVAIDAAGLRVCRPLPLKYDAALRAGLDCHEALVGTGEAEFEVAFPEQPPFISPAKVQIFNAGVTGNKTKLILQAHLRAPVSAFLLVPVTVSKIHNGRYGLEAAAKMPKVAGGYGSLTSLSLKLGREFAYRGQQHSYLLAKCPDGHLQAKGVEVFGDGSRLSGSVVRDCIPQAETLGQVG
jgi:hypothetical protein